MKEVNEPKWKTITVEMTRLEAEAVYTALKTISQETLKEHVKTTELAYAGADVLEFLKAKLEN